MKINLLPKTILAAIFFATISVHATEPYDITFAGRGESTTVESVTVENLTQNTSLTLNGTDILRLTENPTGIEDPAEIAITKPILYPNPAYGKGTLIFDTSNPGQAMVTIADMSGRLLNSANFNLEQGRYSISLPAMPSGMYLVNIKGAGVNQGFKWMCVGDGTGNGAITLNGASNQTLPVVQTRAAATRSDVEVVEMKYDKGDLLRFIGESGNMRTIAMNSPTCSHDITFDFYTCIDASGYNYTIVRAGDLLWMAEDLRYTSSKQALLMQDAEMWQEYKSQAIAAYYNFDESNAGQGAYYTLTGAQKAIPAGWNLPTAGEVDYMVKALGGYNTAAGKLKARGEESFWATNPTDLDSISFAAQPYGHLTPEGTFDSYGNSVRYLTRSIKDGQPIYFELTDEGILKLDPKVVVDNSGYGFHVRACRQAPSSYSSMMKLFGSSPSPAPGSQPRRARAFESGPIGANYTLAVENKKLFTNIGTSYLNSIPQRHDYNSTNKEFTSHDIDKADDGMYLKKAAAQKNAEGYENLVIAHFDRKIGGTAGMYPNYDGGNIDLTGKGHVVLTIYGDSTQNYKQLKSITLPTEFTMPYITTVYKFSESFLSNSVQECLYRLEKYSKRFNIVCADFNGDNIDEIVVVLGNRVEIYDGASLELLSGATFPSDNIRIAVGDVDNDPTQELALLYPVEATTPYSKDEKTQVEVYKGGNLAEISYTTSIQYSEMNDIKIGNVSGNGKNSIVCYTRPSFISDIWKMPKLTLLDYDTQTTGLLRATEVELPTSDKKTSMNTITLVHTRGAMYPADIAINDYIQRYDAETKTLTRVTQLLLFGDVVFSDNMIAGNFDQNKEGKEQLIYISYSTSTSSQNIRGYLKMQNGENSTDLKSAISGWSVQVLNNDNYDNYKELINFHCLAAVRSSEQAKLLKFTEWQATMSEPRIYALLAAPPYYKEKADGTPYKYEYDFGTSWGKSIITGGGSENSSSHKVTAIFGYEQEFNAPIIAKKIGGIDFETKLESEWTKSTEREETITKSNEFTTVNDDGVILCTTFYDTYTYEITRSSNSDEIGTKLIISIPQQPRTLMITLSDYNRLAADNPLIPNLRQVFKHTVGEPFSYPSETDQIISNVPGTPIYWGGSFEGNDFIGTGSGGMLNRNITLDSRTAQSSGFTFNMEMELVGTVMGVKAGAGYGYNNSNTTTHIEGEGHSVAGSVAGLRELGEAGLPDFRWNICWFQYEISGQTFPVVYYVVKE